MGALIQLTPQRPESTCPKCLHVGDTEADFGYRLMRGKQRTQSYCRSCRGGKRREQPAAQVITQAAQLLIFGGEKQLKLRGRKAR